MKNQRNKKISKNRKIKKFVGFIGGYMDPDSNGKDNRWMNTYSEVTLAEKINEIIDRLNELD